MSAHGFEHHGDRTVHHGHVWKVVAGSFTGPDGEPFERDVVRSPGAVATVPIRDVDGAPWVVLVRQYRAAFDDLVIEVPAGMRDIEGEAIEATAERELVEEAGYRAGHLEHLVDFYPSTGMTDSVLHVFLATDLVAVERAWHGVEEQHMEVLELPLAETLAMIDRGAIHDAKTIIGLLLAERHLGAHAEG